MSALGITWLMFGVFYLIGGFCTQAGFAYKRGKNGFAPDDFVNDIPTLMFVCALTLLYWPITILVWASSEFEDD